MMTIKVVIIIWVTIITAIRCEPVLSISSELGDIHVNREYKLIFNDEIGYN